MFSLHASSNCAGNENTDKIVLNTEKLDKNDFDFLRDFDQQEKKKPEVQNNIRAPLKTTGRGYGGGRL